jgi:hypothetical protein
MAIAPGIMPLFVICSAMSDEKSTIAVSISRLPSFLVNKLSFKLLKKPDLRCSTGMEKFLFNYFIKIPA